MRQEQFTVIVTSNKEYKTKVLSVSKTWVYTAIVAFGLFASVFSFVAVDYAQLLIKDSRASYLKAQNLELKRQVKDFGEKIELVQVDLEKIKRFSSKLQLITSGENESSRQLNDEFGEPILDDHSEEGPHDHNHGRAVASLSPATEKTATSANKSIFNLFPLFKNSPSEFTFMNSINESDLTLSFEKAAVDAKRVERDVTLLFERIASKRDLLAATPSIRPAGGWLSSGFGYRRDPFTGKSKFHKGIDFAARTGTAVFAPADGVVSFAGREGGYGKIVSIDHGYGLVTRYAHNSRLLVKTGQRVSRWEKIAEVGSTGRSSGPHLHYEVRVNGVPVNPENYILNN